MMALGIRHTAKEVVVTERSETYSPCLLGQGECSNASRGACETRALARGPKRNE